MTSSKPWSDQGDGGAMTVLSYTSDIMADRRAFEKASQGRRSAVGVVADLSGRGEDALVDEPLPESDAVIEVDFQDDHGRPPGRSEADQDRTFPAKVPLPFVTPRIEQWDDLVR